MSLFHHNISFQPVDPYADVRDEIRAEQQEPEAIRLEEGVNETELEQRWEEITREARIEQES
jgi:hypothetical protein